MTVKVKVGELRKLLEAQPDDAQVVIKRGTLYVQQLTKLVLPETKPVTEQQPVVQ